MRTQLHADDGRARDSGGSPFARESGCARTRERALLEFVRTGGEVSVVDLPGAAPLAARQALSQ